MVNEHPAYEQEKAYLEETLIVVEDEQAEAKALKEKTEAELSYARIYDNEALPLREVLYTAAVNRYHNMIKARTKPYFSHIEFKEKDGTQHTYYIGKVGISKSESLFSQVIDWRAPVANLYYSGQIGPMQYTAPDGEVQGELLLKRQIGIENAQLVSLFDTDVVAQEAYLQSVLSSMTGDRLRDIVTTIQAEQNFVIRHPLNKTLIVQGVAGSGKTTIALHRIAYLLYAFQDILRPDQMLILAPSPLFLNFIAGVLPDLGVENVRQSTFPLFMMDWLGDFAPASIEPDRTDSILEADDEQFREAEWIGRTKGSLHLEQVIDEWMGKFEKKLIPESGISFGPVKLFTKEQADRFLLVDEKPFPIARRIKEFEKQLRIAANGAAQRINAWYLQECDRRAEKIKQQVADPQAQKEMLDKLYRSRDKQIEDTKKQVKPFVRKVIDNMPDCTPLTVFKQFWKDMLESKEADMRLTAESVAKQNGIEPEDIAALAIIAMHLQEMPRTALKHIVIDEAQDFSPLEVQALRRMVPGATMTIVGDMMQGIRSWRGLPDWTVLQKNVFMNKAIMHHLQTSYRSTVEIMEFASKVAKKRPVAGQRTAKPVLRHGEIPSLIRFDTEEEQAREIDRIVEKWQKEGMSGICIAARRQDTLAALKVRLKCDARIIEPGEEEYSAGVVLASAATIKGLEFDGVIVADASGEQFENRDADARLLYVCLTRALHKECILSTANLTPLLR